MTWNRECDRILAEKCERLTVEAYIVPAGFTEYGVRLHDRPLRHSRELDRFESIPHYNTDIAACIRAAEGWRLQKPGRSYNTSSAKTYTIGKQTVNNPAHSACLEDSLYIAGCGEHLHEALYEAVANG